jgi:hypothetical protein
MSLYTGTIIRDLDAAVRQVFIRHSFELRQSSVDRDDALEILRSGQIHLTDRRDSRTWPSRSRWPVMDSGDQAAYEILRELATCLETGLTDVCQGCGHLEGQHAFFTRGCPDGSGTWRRPC